MGEEEKPNQESSNEKSSSQDNILHNQQPGNSNIDLSTTKDMEVHQHAHHDGKKNWNTYFWEFLMLFLAVFCGFLAEYILEHTIEHQREAQYMQSFITDLENDTTNLNYGFPRKDSRIIAIDSTFLFFETHSDVNKIPGYVYRNIQRTIWDRHYRRNSTTIDQLKNAGGMRLIRHKNVADSIASYDLQWQRAEFWRELYMTNLERGKELIANIIYANDLLPEYRNNIYRSFTP